MFFNSANMCILHAVFFICRVIIYFVSPFTANQYLIPKLLVIFTKLSSTLTDKTKLGKNFLYDQN